MEETKEIQWKKFSLLAELIWQTYHVTLHSLLKEFQIVLLQIHKVSNRK